MNKLQDKSLGMDQLQNSSRYLSGGFETFSLLRLPCLISDRTKAGLVAAKARGRCGGRPRLMDENKIQQAKALINEKKFSMPEICRSLGVSRGTLYRNLQA